MTKRTLGFLFGCSAMAATSMAWAQGVSLSAGADTATGASGDASAPSAAGWLEQFKPEPNLVEIGLFAGVLVPAKTHNLQDETKPNVNFKPVAPEFGLRAAYFPIQFAGAEVDLGLAPTGTEDGGGAFLWALRGQAIVQAPLWRIVPFGQVGFGVLSASSDTMGSDADPLWHLGVGVKAALTREILLRLDLRDNITQANNAAAGVAAYSPEVLIGASWVLGRSDAAPTPPPAPPDGDGDGVADADDACPKESGPKPSGCPPKDQDGDGILDDADKCPVQKGEAPTGCPDPDPDKDGVLDPVDRCPTTKEDGKPPDAKDGCPSDDGDGDGISGDRDKCPEQPETKNGYDDDDGCPDEKPLAVLGEKEVVITQAIQFANDKATIDPASLPIVDAVAKVMVDHPEIQLAEVAGHASHEGDKFKNRTLTQKRSEAVAAALVERGVAKERLVAQGYGFHCPLDPTNTPAAHAANRRVQFLVLRLRDQDTGVMRGCAEAEKNGIKPKAAPAAKAPATAKKP